MLGRVDDARMQEARRKALAWLDERWPEERRICPIDGSRTWALTDLVQFNRFTPDSVMLGEVYPAIQLVCTTCGYMVHFSAITAGLVEGSMLRPERRSEPPTADPGKV
jgi:hypothetical protein